MKGGFRLNSIFFNQTFYGLKHMELLGYVWGLTFIDVWKGFWLLFEAECSKTRFLETEI